MKFFSFCWYAFFANNVIQSTLVALPSLVTDLYILFHNGER